MSGCTWAPKLATKCEMDGRATGVWSRDYQIFRMDSFSQLRGSAITNKGPETSLMTSDLLIPCSNDILQIKTNLCYSFQPGKEITEKKESQLES